MIEQVRASARRRDDTASAGTQPVPASRPALRCTVVSWDSPGWAERIARNVRLALQEKEMQWAVELCDARIPKSLGTVNIAMGRGGFAERGFWLLVVQARSRQIRMVYDRFHWEIASSDAGLVVVDCRVESLRALSHTVQGMPRWPLGWLPALDDGERACKAFVHRFVQMLAKGIKDNGEKGHLAS